MKGDVWDIGTECPVQYIVRARADHITLEHERERSRRGEMEETERYQFLVCLIEKISANLHRVTLT